MTSEKERRHEEVASFFCGVNLKNFKKNTNNSTFMFIFAAKIFSYAKKPFNRIIGRRRKSKFGLCR